MRAASTQPVSRIFVTLAEEGASALHGFDLMGDTLDRTIEQLQELLNLLYIPTDSDDMLTSDDVDAPRGEAIAVITQWRRIMRASRNYDNMGLFEFHVGLIYLKDKQIQLAAQYFIDARRLWSFVDRTAASCLTYFAEASCLQLVRDNETAMIVCGRGLRCLDRYMRFGVRTNQIEFVERLRAYLEAEQRILRERLRQRLGEQTTGPGTHPPPGSEDGETTERAEPEPESTTGPPDTSIYDTPAVQSPIVNPAFGMPHHYNTPIPGHLLQDEELVWFEVYERRPDNFEEEILIDTYILARKIDASTNIKPHSYVVSRYNDGGGSIRLKRFGESAIGTRIYLGAFTTAITTKFTRDAAGKVKFSSDHEVDFDLIREDILGIVVGIWRRASIDGSI